MQPPIRFWAEDPPAPPPAPAFNAYNALERYDSSFANLYPGYGATMPDFAAASELTPQECDIINFVNELACNPEAITADKRTRVLLTSCERLRSQLEAISKFVNDDDVLSGKPLEYFKSHNHEHRPELFAYYKGQKAGVPSIRPKPDRPRVQWIDGVGRPPANALNGAGLDRLARLVTRQSNAPTSKTSVANKLPEIDPFNPPRYIRVWLKPSDTGRHLLAQTSHGANLGRQGAQPGEDRMHHHVHMVSLTDPIGDAIRSHLTACGYNKTDVGMWLHQKKNIWRQLYDGEWAFPAFG